MNADFIAFDWCGFNDRYGRFTAVPGGETLLQQAWMVQRDWDKQQLEWFLQFDGAVTVHKCLHGPYTKEGESIGTVSEITARLQNKLK